MHEYDIYFDTRPLIYNETYMDSKEYTGPTKEKARADISLESRYIPFSVPLGFEML